MFERVRNAARGREGGAPGRRGRVTVPGVGEMRVKGREIVPPGRSIVLETPGGGGLGDPRSRDRQKVRDDVVDGLLSAAAAREEYRWEGDSDDVDRGHISEAYRSRP